MGTYRIAGLHVYMEPQFTQILTTSEKFKTDGCFPAQITIPYKRCDYERWLRERPHLTLSDAENSCTCNFFAAEVIKYDAIVLHASALLFHGKAYLFSADSGVGKTTHTKLWQQYFGNEKAVIINDDKPVVRLIDGAFFACGTPWCGNSQECENITAPLGAIIFLNRGKENHIERLFKTAQILPLLLMQTVHRTSAGKLDMVLAFADRLIQSVPVYKLDCTMDVEAVKIVSETII